MALQAKLDGNFSKASKLLQKLVAEESQLCWFQCLSQLRLPGELECPAKKALIQLLQSHGFRASGTLFDGEGVKTDATVDKIFDLLRKAAAIKSEKSCHIELTTSFTDCK